MKGNHLKSLFDANPRPDEEMNEPYKLMLADVEFGELNVWKRRISHQNIHSHDYYQIWYIVNGSCLHCVDALTYSLSAGDLFLIMPYSYHSMSNGSSDLCVIGIDFTESFLEKFSKEINFLYFINSMTIKQSKHVPNFLANEAFENIIYEMFIEFSGKQKYYEEIIYSDLSKVLILLTREFEKKNEVPPLSLYQRQIISLAINWIDKNYNKKTKISDMCSLTNVSSAYFSLLFKKFTGQTFIEYVNTVRLNKAKQLLSETSWSITDIAYKVGFDDAVYFSRTFKAHVGVSPIMYRKKNSPITE